MFMNVKECRSGLMAKRSWNVVTVDNGLARPDMKLKVLENAFELAGFFSRW